MASLTAGTTRGEPHGRSCGSDAQLLRSDLASIRLPAGPATADSGLTEGTKTIDSTRTPKNNATLVHPPDRPTTGANFKALPLELQQHILLLALGPCLLKYETWAAIESGRKTARKMVTEREQEALETLIDLSLVDRSFSLAMTDVRKQYLKRPMRLHEFVRFLDSGHTDETTHDLILDLELDARSERFVDSSDFSAHIDKWETAFMRLPRNVQFIRLRCLPRLPPPERHLSYGTTWFSYPRPLAMRLVTWALVRTRGRPAKLTWELVERSL